MDGTFKLQKRLSGLISFFGLAIFFVSFAINLSPGSNIWLRTLSLPTVSFPLLVSALFYITGNIDSDRARILQTTCVAVITVLALLSGDASFSGPFVLGIAVLLAYRYGFLGKNLTVTIPIILIAAAALLEISSVVERNGEEGASIIRLVFLLLLAFFLIAVYREDINRISNRTRELRIGLNELEKQKKHRAIQKCLHSVKHRKTSAINTYIEHVKN